ncbi:MAG TPA: S41 family peptidase [Gemmatimonadales bacterium]|nr:S41 family peptidase [Gemmatimonadales bacterium]
MMRVSFALMAVATGAFLAGREVGPRHRSESSARDSLLDNVIAAIRTYYVDSLDEMELTRLAARSMVAQLGDPYSRLLDETGYRAEFPSATGTASAPRLEDGTGIITLPIVSAGSASALRGTIAAYERDGLHGLVLDLRGNPGGFVNEAAHIADLFLDQAIAIGWLRGRTERQSQRFIARTRQLWPDLPLVVLVDGRTASAAELIAGSLQEHDRAVIVGTPTFGKGLAQTPIALGRGLVLELSTARWYTAVGRPLDRAAADGGGRYYSDRGRQLPDSGGVAPDILIETGAADPLDVALDLLRHCRTTEQLLARVEQQRSAVAPQ